MLPMIFVLPIVQVILLVYAATMEIKNVDFLVIDMDKSQTSRELISKFDASKYFTLAGYYHSEFNALESVASGDAKMIIIIPPHLERDLYRNSKPNIQFIINAEDGSAAGLIQSYAMNIALGFNKHIAAGFAGENLTKPPVINVVERFRYNPEMDYKQYMAPGILVILVTFIGMFLAAMNVVKEKEIGTIEQLNVTPIKKHQFLIGKLLPFWFIGVFILALGLTIAKLFFDIPIEGSLLLLGGLTALYLLVVLSAALLISTITNTQQQAMFIAWFFVVIFIIMSGIFTPIDSMPKWAQTITLFNPIAHFAEIVRRVLLKGAGFDAVEKQFWILLAYGIVMMLLAQWRYKKVN